MTSEEKDAIELRKNNSKIAYDTFSDIYKMVLEQMKFSEAKNSILTTFNIAIATIYLRFYFFIQNDFTSIDRIIYFILLLILLAALFFSIKSFFPNMDNNEKSLPTPSDINIYFFKDILKLHSNTYTDTVLNKIGILRNDLNNINQINDLANQITVLSKLVSKKYQNFKISIIILSVFGSLFFLFYCYLFWRCLWA